MRPQPSRNDLARATSNFLDRSSRPLRRTLAEPDYLAPDRTTDTPEAEIPTTTIPSNHQCTICTDDASGRRIVLRFTRVPVSFVSGSSAGGLGCGADSQYRRVLFVSENPDGQAFYDADFGGGDAEV